MFKPLALTVAVLSACAFAAGCASTSAHQMKSGDASAGTSTAATGAAGGGAQSGGNAGLAAAANWTTPENVPPNAKAGECYTRAYVPPVYKEVEEQVLKRSAGENVDIVPAKYEEAEERVIVKPASKRVEVVPATYETVEERVMIRPASKRIEQVPARYETVTEQVQVAAAYTAWKKGVVPGATSTKVDESTGEVLCLVEVPAQYKTITKEVLKSPATTKEVEIPAEYTTIKKQVVKTPATTREVEVPAEFGTVKVQKLVTPAKETRTAIPAEYQTVKRSQLVSEARLEWRSILCATNSTPQKVSEIQTSLKKAGFDPGRTDGVATDQTFSAINAFQKAKGLPVDTGRYINLATVKALGAN